VEEVPLLKELYTQYKDQGVVVVGISVDKDVKLVQEMVLWSDDEPQGHDGRP
jgi:hypothetical protein